jgi:prevent-host-death family protein
MKFARVRELKSKTSAMLKTVEHGNTVLVTTHGRPTAMLVPGQAVSRKDSRTPSI